MTRRSRSDRHHGAFVLEAIMITTQYTTQDLKKLPLKAIVAFTARCARRGWSLSQFPEFHPHREARHLAIDNAIRLARRKYPGALPATPSSLWSRPWRQLS